MIDAYIHSLEFLCTMLNDEENAVVKKARAIIEELRNRDSDYKGLLERIKEIKGE